MNTTAIAAELQQAASLLNTFMAQPENLERIAHAAEVMATALQKGHKIISCGNGGSHCDAMHFAEELSGRYRKHRPSLAAISISDPSHISCTANDYGYEFVFSRFVEGLGQPGDVLLAISTSGNAANVQQAIQAATAKGMQVVLLTGATGGKVHGSATVEINVPHSGFADRIQEVHIKVIHILIMLIEQALGHAE